MKSGKRRKGFRLWRTAQGGLKKMQQDVDRAVEASTDPRELAASGLADLKLRITREVRENYQLELKSRREELELQDLEIAHRSGTSLMLRIKAEHESQLAQLLALKDLNGALSGPAQPDQPTGDKPLTPQLEIEATGDDTAPDPSGASDDAGPMGHQDGTPDDRPDDLERSGATVGAAEGVVGGETV